MNSIVLRNIIRTFWINKCVDSGSRHGCIYFGLHLLVSVIALEGQHVNDGFSMHTFTCIDAIES
jgi:hypothetical protein